MKLETAVIISKATCLTTIPMVSALGAGASQLNTPTVLGIPKEVLVLICTAYTAGAGGLLAFLSQSFGTFMSNRNGNGVSLPDPGQPKPPTP